MPLDKYGVLVGKAIEAKLGFGQSPHYQVLIIDEQTKYRIAINVKSKAFPSELLYLINESFEHPIIESIQEMPLGFHEVSSQSSDRRLDFIRGNLFDPVQMIPLAHDIPGPDNDLNEKIDFYIRRAISDDTATVYAFGEPWGPEPYIRDRYFGFRPGNGIHNIHMNQGNQSQWRRDDGVWQDGALLIHFPLNNQWVGIFLAFQSQSWHTDDQTGHTISVTLGDHFPSVDPNQPRPLPQATGNIRIVAAFANPEGQESGREAIYLLNTTPNDIDLTGWILRDKLNRSTALDGQVISTRGILKVTLTGQTTVLANNGGIITLVDAQGLKVDGVSYTKEQASKQDWLIAF